MNVLRAITTELLGLFVDDGSLALGILSVVGCAAALALAAHAPAFVSGGVLLAGCLAVLAENLRRAAKKT